MVSLSSPCRPRTHNSNAFMTTGDVVSVSVLGQNIVILNTCKAAVDLLEKRSAIYSDRPFLYMAGHTLTWDQTLVLSPYGDQFRDIRRLLAQFMGTKKSVVKFREVMNKEAHDFLRRVLREPEDFAGHIRKSADFPEHLRYAH